MAHYIQDYLYTELPEGFVSDVIQWFRVESFKDLPRPSAAYLMMAALTDDGASYLCVESNNSYTWVKFFDENLAVKVTSLTEELKALMEVVNTNGINIEDLQGRATKLEEDLSTLDSELLKVIAIQSDLTSEVSDLSSEVGKLSDTVDALLELENRILELETTVDQLKTKLNKYPEMPEYNPGANYYVLVFDSEGKPYWCPNYFPQ